jgi:hypothetical protein
MLTPPPPLLICLPFSSRNEVGIANFEQGIKQVADADHILYIVAGAQRHPNGYFHPLAIVLQFRDSVSVALVFCVPNGIAVGFEFFK